MKGLALIAGFLALEAAFLLHTVLPSGLATPAAQVETATRKVAPAPAGTVQAGVVHATAPRLA